MNRSWTHKNIARSVQFGEVYPVYQGGEIHKALDTPSNRVGTPSGGPYTPISFSAFSTLGGSWSALRKNAISWSCPNFIVGTQHAQAYQSYPLYTVNIFNKFTQGGVSSIPNTRYFMCAAVTAQKNLVLFFIGRTSGEGFIRVYPPLTGSTVAYSAIIQPEVSLGTGWPTTMTSGWSVFDAYPYVFTQDARSLARIAADSVQIFRLSPDYTAQTSVTVTTPATPQFVGVDGLKFFVLTVNQEVLANTVYAPDPVVVQTVVTYRNEDPCGTPDGGIDRLHYTSFEEYHITYQYDISSISPVWGTGDINPLVDDPLSWTVGALYSSVFNSEHHSTSDGSNTHGLPRESDFTPLVGHPCGYLYEVGFMLTYEILDDRLDLNWFNIEDFLKTSDHSLVYASEDILIYVESLVLHTTLETGTNGGTDPTVETLTGVSTIFLRLDGVDHILHTEDIVGFGIPHPYTSNFVKTDKLLYVKFYGSYGTRLIQTCSLHIDLLTREFSFTVDPPNALHPLALIKL